MDAGYDEGYKHCPCFWGSKPGSLIVELMNMVASFRGIRAADLGCGEGKNAMFLANQGAEVDAFEVSRVALQNARNHWKNHAIVNWIEADVREVDLSPNNYDIVICYGLFHCFRNEKQVFELVEKIRHSTKPNGLNIVCAFNSRKQELEAHAGFTPLLLSHSKYLNLYSDWSIELSSDEDLYETHPHNNIPHTHSMTRLIARKS